MKVGDKVRFTGNYPTSTKRPPFNVSGLVAELTDIEPDAEYPYKVWLAGYGSLLCKFGELIPASDPHSIIDGGWDEIA